MGATAHSDGFVDCGLGDMLPCGRWGSLKGRDGVSSPPGLKWLRLGCLV